ncbi:hypothetical protein OG21DRAFT_1447259 [Imleria badia]|nr:hypothetical protein OG21DRAFT_1447259 [Imleria badia]
METEEVATNAMMDALRSVAHQKLTANDAPAFSSTLVSTLDAYLGLRSGIPGEKVDHYLENAWAEDPNLTLRIIWSTRSIHDGKGEKELFYRAFGWLFKNHPRTAIANLHCLVDPVCLRSNKDAEKKKEKKKKKKKKTGASHGCWKDLLDILALATLDELQPNVPLDPRSNFLHNYYDGKSRPAFKNNEEQEEWSRTQRDERSRRAHDCFTKKLLDNHYRALYVAVARLFAGQLAKDSDVMDKIAALPADADKNDRMALMYALTLVSKWAPTPGGSHDRVTNISSAICLLLHEAQVSPQIAHKISLSPTTSLPESDMHSLRYVYQKHILTRGRRYTCIPEPLMSSNRWSEITYSRVASVCMNKNKERFFIRDEERFLKYLEDVESGKKQISGATLLPHLLAIEAVQIYRQQGSLDVRTTRSLAKALHEQQRRLAEARTRVVDAQWATLVARLRESGQLDNCIAVCDVSGSMGSVGYASTPKPAFDVSPIWPSISLSLLVARLAKPPFNDSFITFSTSPQFVTVDPESSHVPLGATIDRMGNAKWGANTDFNAVFLKLILPLAVKHNVPKDQMIKRIFVFSDMQFDSANNKRVAGWSYGTAGWSQASSTTPDAAAEWKTNHDVIAEAYAQAGYDVPELVYWDLSNPRDGHGITAPVTGDRQGVALLSGYSPSLLKVFMDVEEEEEWEILDKDGQAQPERASLTPEELMKKALGRKSYDGLVVVD